MNEDPTTSAALSRLRTRLLAPQGARRIDELLALDDAAAAVAELPAAEVYELVHSAGFEDAGELIALATPAQVRGCLDLDTWDKDSFLAEGARPWLTALLEVGFEKVGEVWAGLDAEVRALLVARFSRVYDVSLGEHPDEPLPGEEPAADGPLYGTPDGFFVLRLLGDDETQRLLPRLIEDLYRADPALARHTVQAARAEPMAELEEMSYRWRSGRMADQGYVDFHDALELFHPLELDQIKLGTANPELEAIEAESAVPAPVARQVLARSFLARCLAEVESPELAGKLEAAIFYLVNRLLAAARARPGQQEVLERAALYGSATLSLGLEAVARGEPARGAQALIEVALPQLFRVGYTLGLRLAKLAVALAPRARRSEPPAAEALAALCSPRPLWAGSADNPPRAGVRPLESLADVRRAAELLRALTAKVALAERLGVPLGTAGDAPTLEAFLRTALLRVAGGGSLEAHPMSGSELAAARRRAFDGGRLTGAARERCHDAVLASLRDEPPTAAAARPMSVADLPPVIEALLAQLEDALGPVTDPQPQPRLLGDLLVFAAG